MSALSGNIKEDKDFLQVFWDLASEEDDVRLSASERLIRHLTAIAASDDANKQQEYQDYTLKRLVRGLTSPRDAARQGFAVSLCEALRVFPYGLEEVLALVDEHTQTGGSLKGAEERDALFGKLFGLAALLRADLLFSERNAAQAKESLVSLTERVVGLHQTKQWIQETTVETLLLLLSRAADQLLQKKPAVDEETLSAVLAKVVALSNTSSFEANNEHQLSLLLGLQCWSKRESKLQALLAQALSAHKIPAIEIAHMDTFVAALFHSTNKFPKFHKVWEYFMSFIVPMNKERELERAQTLDEAQQTALSVFTGFLDEHVWHASKEKRSVALKLVVKLVSLLPADALPLVLSSSFVRCLLLCRLKSQNLLFDFAGGVLRDLVRCVHGEADRTLALLSALSQHGGAQFDKRTQTRTVSGLLENLSFATTKEYLQLLCSLVAAPSTETAVRESETETAEEDKEANNSSTATTTLHSLVALARLSSPLLSAQEREDVQVAVLSVLLRMTCFGEGRTETLSEAEPETETEGKKKDKKKDGKKNKAKEEKKKEEPEPLALQCIKLVEGESVAVSLSAELSTLAAQQFISLISDIALKSDKPSAVLVRVFAVLSGLARFPSLQERASERETENSEEDHEDEVVVSLPELAELTHTVLKELLALSLSASAQEKDAENKEKDAPRVSRLASSAAALLATVSAHSLAGKEVARSIALQTAALLRALVEKAQQEKSDEEKEEEEDDEEDALDLTLLEICTELFALPSEQTVKGVRDAAKRVWAQLFPLLGEGVSQSFLDALVGQVTEADEADNAAEGEGQREERATAEDDEENEEEEEEEDDGGSDQEEEEEEAKAPQKRSAESAAAEKASKKAKTASAIAQRESAEKEIVLGEEEMLGFLMEDDEEINAELGLAAEDKDEDAESDNEGVLVHTAEADAALIKMISLRKESRKQGLVAAKRKQVLLRSRLLDILEIFVQKQRSGELLFSLFVPLLLGAKKLFTSKLLQEIPEGRPFALRLQNLLEKQLCKKKFAIKFSDDEEKETDCLEELEVLSDLLQKMLASKLAPLRSVAQETLVAVARTIIASDSEACKQKVLELFRAITRRFLSLRRSNVPAKWLEDVITQRFPSFFLPHLFDDLVQSLQSTTTSAFVRNEVIEIANTVFKRMSSFDANTQSVLCAQLGTLCETLSTSVQETITLLSTGATASEDKEQKKDEAGKGAKKANNAKEIINGSTKKLRSTLALMKTVVDTIARSKTDCSLSALTTTLENVKSFAAASAGVSPAIAQLAEQSLQQIAKIAASKETVAETKKEKKSSDKKKEGKESKKTDDSVPSKKRKADEEVAAVKKSSKKK